MKHFKGLILLFLLLLCSNTSIFAATASAAFDMQQANQILIQLSRQLTISENTLPQLEAASKTLAQFQLQAKTCTTNIQTALTTVNLQIQDSRKITDLKTSSADQKFLQQKKDILTAQLSDCRLFLLQSKDLLDKYNAAAHQLATRTLLTAEPTVVAKITGNVAAIKEFPQQFNKSIFIEFSGVEFFNFRNLAFFGVFLLFVIFITYKLKNSLHTALNKKVKPSFGAQLTQAFLCSLNHYLFPLNVFLSVALFTTIIGASVSTWPNITFLSYGLLIYFIVMLLLTTFLHPPKPAESITRLPENLSLSLFRRLRSLLWLVLAGYFIYALLREQSFAPITVSLARTIFISLLAINLINIVWLINRTPKVIYLHPLFRSCLSLILSITLISILLTEWLGYHAIANYLLLGISLTLLSSFIAWLLNKIIISSINTLAGDQHPWQQHLHQYLGIKKHQAIPELIWLRIVTHLTIWIGFGIALLKIWGISQIYFQKLLNALVNGFAIAHFYIEPLHVLLAFLVFTLLVAATRFIRTRVSHHPDFKDTPGARDALAAIVGYIGFVLATLFALLLAGVNFAGLAIIAGALSVGIGFGLQNIVNNFVSGIILLIERPIKLGDRIIVGGTEGYVRKISMRFTQIETSQKSDVIIPNSELISQQVINLMYRNDYSRITLPISVTYGTDTELLKSVLLEVAQKNSAVIHNYPANEAKVEFKQFGASSLDFELSCLIKDVNEQARIKSDLLFAIDNSFRKNNIELAAARHEVYLHSLSSTDLKNK